jgi:hypothetical protein
MIRSVRLAAGLVGAGRRFRAAPRLIASMIAALMFAALLVLLTLPSIVGDLTVRHQLNGLAPAERSVTVVVSPERQPTVAERSSFDATVQTQLSVPGFGATTRVTSFRSLSSPQGSLYRLVGTENIKRALRLSSGRWPASCTKDLCEVLSVGAASVARSGRGTGTIDLPDVSYLRVVGRAIPGPTFPFVGALAPSSGELLVVADGPDAVQAVTTLRLIRRVNGWIAPIVPSDVSTKSVASLVDGAARIRQKIDIPGVSVEMPSDELEDALGRSKSSGRTIAIVGAQLLSLLLVSCAVSGFALRQNHLLAYDRLKRRGANGALLGWFTALSSLLVVLIGSLIGLVLGLGTIAVVVRLVDVSLNETLRGLIGVRPFMAVTVAALLVFGMITSAMNDRASRPVVRFGRIRLSDLVALAVVVVVVGVLLVARTPNTLVDDSSETVLRSAGSSTSWWWPIAVTGALLWLAWRVLSGVLLFLRVRMNKLRSTNPAAALLGTRSLARQRVSLTSAALASIAAAVCVFAIGTRSTLAPNSTDQAGYSVPLEYRLRVGSSLVRPDELRSSKPWQALPTSIVETDVVRRGVAVLGGSGDGAAEVIGIDPLALRHARYWRADYGSRRNTARLQTEKPAPIGASIDSSATELVVEVSGDWKNLDIAAVLERTNGTWHELRLTESGANSLSAVLEEGDPGGRLLGYRIGLKSFFAEQIEHKIGEGNTFTGESRLTIEIAGARSMPGRRRIDLDPASLRSDQAILRPGPAGGLEVRVALQGSSVLVLPDVAIDPIPAVVDATTAQVAGGAGETFFVETLQRRIAFRIIGIATRFPTAADRFIVADVNHVARQFNLAQPGFGTPTEAWVGVRPGAQFNSDRARLGATLTAAPLNQLLVNDQRSIAQQLRRDPLRQMSVAILLATAILGALVTAIGLAISALSDTADQEQFRRTLRLEGVSDRTIGRAIGRRILLGSVVLLPFGCIAGVVLLRATARDLGAGAVNEVTGLSLRSVVSIPFTLISLLGIVVLFALATHAGSRSTGSSLNEADLLRGRT